MKMCPEAVAIACEAGLPVVSNNFTLCYESGITLLWVLVPTRAILFTECCGAAGTAMWHKSCGSAPCFMGHRSTMRNGAAIWGMAFFSNVTSEGPLGRLAALQGWDFLDVHWCQPCLRKQSWAAAVLTSFPSVFISLSSAEGRQFFT